MQDPGGVAALRRKIDERTAKVVVVGQGYVGLPVAMRAVRGRFPGRRLRHRRPSAVEARWRRAARTCEDVSDEQLAAALAAGTRPTCDAADLRDFDVAVITVQTPLREGIPDLSFIEAAARDLAAWLAPGALVVLESTTYPGTTDELLRPILEESGLRVAAGDFFLGYSPERIDPATREWTFVNTAKVVSGIDAASLSVVEAFYGALVDKVVPVGVDRRGRAGQAAREHVPAREHRARQRARDVRRAASASTSGRRSTRRPPSRTASCASRPVRASAATACRSTPRTSRGASSSGSASGSGSSSSPTR